ncbi:S1C family serine protease [Luedemannella flava]|uniref:S1C family serine protease n=1 Tax=Luedemannella flava TaxID=349316 RepID=UPI0031D904C5
MTEPVRDAAPVSSSDASPVAAPARPHNPQPQSPWQQPGPATSTWPTSHGTPQAPPPSPYANPATTHVYPQPAYGQPTTGQPAYGQPYGQTGYGQSGYPHTGAPVTGQPTTGQIPPWATNTTQQPKKPSRAGRIIGVGLAVAVLAGGFGVAGGYVGAALQDSGGTSITKVFGSAPVVDRSSLADIAAKVQPSVVHIMTDSGEGSGIVMTSDGYVLTNNHVIAGAKNNTVTVGFSNGKKAKATIKGTDPRTDVGVIKVEGVSDLTAAEFADSDGVRVGDTVLAIGSPLGLEGSVSAGIVSALHRTISVGGEQQSPFEQGTGTTTIGDALQTDAAINPGNSGGALVNTEGKVVGVNTAIATGGSSNNGNIGVGFAISSNKAKSVADQIIKGIKVSHPYLGVKVTDAETGGAKVTSVETGSPADKAGLKVNDVVTKVGGQTVGGSEDLVAAVQAGTVGQNLTLTVIRGGSEQTLTATLGEAP